MYKAQGFQDVEYLQEYYKFPDNSLVDAYAMSKELTEEDVKSTQRILEGIKLPPDPVPSSKWWCTIA